MRSPPARMQTRNKRTAIEVSGNTPRPDLGELNGRSDSGGRFAVARCGSARILTIAAKTPLLCPPHRLIREGGEGAAIWSSSHCRRSKWGKCEVRRIAAPFREERPN